MEEVMSGERPLRVALIGAYGSTNLGDVAIETALINNLRQRDPSLQIFAIAHDPGDAERCFGIPSFPADRDTPLRKESSRSFVGRVFQRIVRIALDGFTEIRFLARSWRTMRRFDLLIAAGGGQLDEYWGGPRGHLTTLFKWAVLCRLTRRRLVVVSVGMCDMETRTGKRLVRRTMSMARYRSFRDERTRKAVQDLGVRSACKVVPDLAFSLTVPETGSTVEGTRAVVGISPIGAIAWTDSADPVFTNYLDVLARFSAALVRSNWRVMFFPSELKMDLPLIPDLLNSTKALVGTGREADVSAAEVGNLDDLVRTIQACDFVVASRLHGVLLSHTLTRPVLAISYHHKVTTHMQDLLQDDYCMDVAGLSAENMLDRFAALKDNADGERVRIASVVAQNRQALDEQYDRLLDMPGSVAGSAHVSVHRSTRR
jgi:polysaccharide pyruvyl transferase WcaK-like protein